MQRRTSVTDYTIEYIKSRTTENKNGCWETIGSLPLGRINGKFIRLARISLALVNPDFDINNPKIYACHKCDNSYCVNPAHLFPGTSSDNINDHHNKVKAGILSSIFSGKTRCTPIQDDTFYPVRKAKA